MRFGVLRVKASPLMRYNVRFYWLPEYERGDVSYSDAEQSWPNHITGTIQDMTILLVSHNMKDFNVLPEKDLLELAYKYLNQGVAYMSSEGI